MIEDIRYTAVQISYYVVCPRKLWLFSKGITQEHESDYVSIGRLIDELTYRRQRERKDAEVLLFGKLKVDFVAYEDGVVINEVKKSNSLEEAHVLQVKYYLWAFKRLGVKVKYGVLRYPKLKRTQKIYLTDEDERRIEEALKGIEVILSLPHPPEPISAPYCKKCAYYMFCYG